MAPDFLPSRQPCDKKLVLAAVRDYLSACGDAWRDFQAGTMYQNKEGIEAFVEKRYGRYPNDINLLFFDTEIDEHRLRALISDTLLKFPLWTIVYGIIEATVPPFQLRVTQATQVAATGFDENLSTAAMAALQQPAGAFLTRHLLADVLFSLQNKKIAKFVNVPVGWQLARQELERGFEEAVEKRAAWHAEARLRAGIAGHYAGHHAASSPSQHWTQAPCPGNQFHVPPEPRTGRRRPSARLMRPTARDYAF